MSNDAKFEILEQFDYIDDEYLQKVADRYGKFIGLFLINFSYLEHELNVAIAEIINERAHETGYVVVERLGFRDKADLFYKMYVRLEPFKGKKTKTLLDRIWKELEEVNTFRNNIAHANWQTLTKEGYVRSKISVDRNEGVVRFKRILMTPQLIRKMTRSIESLINRIDKYRETAFNF